MKIRIHNNRFNDSVDISGETIDELRKIAKMEISKRNWNEADCWSEKMPN